MAYTINLYDGTLLTTVADGTIDTAATNIKLVGKNYTGYGEIMDENFVHMLENFADVSAPTTPLDGQLWWNTSLGTLSVYDGTQFKAVSSSTVSDSEPTGAVEGDLWWDSDDEQLYVYNDTIWILIGPSAAAGSGQSGAIVEIITDDGATDHVVVSTYVADVRISITSGSATFTPDPALAPEYGDIEPGVNLIATGVLANARYQGTATNADLLDNLDSLQFIRADAGSGAGWDVAGDIQFQNDTGIRVGADDDAQLGVTGDNVEFFNRTVSGHIIIGATETGSANRVALTYDPDAETVSFANGAANNKLTFILDPTSAQDAATKNYVDVIVNESGGGPLFRDGSNTITGDILPSGTGTLDLGSVGLEFKDIYATSFIGLATEASYADLAERFEADAPLAPGTVVMLGGAKEICAEMEDLSDDIFGVISTTPGFLMNAKAGNNETHPPVAMSGRVPVRVVGEVRKGDRLVSAGNGLARAAGQFELNPFNTIGRALEDKFTEGEGTVEAIVSMNS